MTSQKNSKSKATAIYNKLHSYFPDAHCELIFHNPFELLMATILSAQCTDEQVNKTTPKLFHHFPTPQKMAAAEIQSIEELIYSTGFYKNKAKHLKFCSEHLVRYHQGQVPEDMNDLIQLPGVGRKTANVVLNTAFDQSVGIVVDTHVKRISTKLKLTKQIQPEKIEQDLMKLFLPEQWGKLSHLFIFLGRRICMARKPLCSQCPIADHCPSKQYQPVSL